MDEILNEEMTGGSFASEFDDGAGEPLLRGLRTSDYAYDLPEELIAQDPLSRRSDSRLMVLDRATGVVSHHTFSDITQFLRAGDCLVLNNTRVIPARLYGVREGTGGHVEILLLKRRDDRVWECLVKPGKKARVGTVLLFGKMDGADEASVDVAGIAGDGAATSANVLLRGEIVDVIEDGNRLIRFSYDGIFEEILDKLGEMPLPPYITHKLKDRDRYQTVYAKYDGSAAAPTAGLHFTEELLGEVRKMGVQIAEVTLHVGLGTFRPVKVDDVTKHKMHTEYFEISEDAANLINETKRNGGRVISVGTTSTRTLETAARVQAENSVRPMRGETDIFIYPGYDFKVIDGLITNFHLPESTLLMLVSALAGRENILQAYDIAVKGRYRFFSFGDAMLII